MRFVVLCKQPLMNRTVLISMGWKISYHIGITVHTNHLSGAPDTTWQDMMKADDINGQWTVVMEVIWARSVVTTSWGQSSTTIYDVCYSDAPFHVDLSSSVRQALISTGELTKARSNSMFHTVFCCCVMNFYDYEHTLCLSLRQPDYCEKDIFDSLFSVHRYYIRQKLGSPRWLVFLNGGSTASTRRIENSPQPKAILILDKTMRWSTGRHSRADSD